MRIVLIGCVKSSEMFLQKLVDMSANIVGVVTKREAKYNSDAADIVAFCEKRGIEYFCCQNVNDNESLAYVKEKKPDLILCLGWSQLLGRELLDIPSKGCIGFHPAALPCNRGRHPLIWALALGLKKTASSLFMLEPTADSGAIISQEYVDISYEDDAEMLYDKVMKKAVNQLEDVLVNFDDRLKNAYIQSSDEGNEWRKRGKADGFIDWRMSSRNIYNLVRALSHPYVGAHLSYKNQDYKVWKVKEIVSEAYQNIEPGKVVEITTEGNPIVKAGDNLIEILSMDAVSIEKGEYIL